MTVSNSRQKIALLTAGIALALLSLGFVYVKWPTHTRKPAHAFMFDDAATYKDIKTQMTDGVQREYLFLHDAIERKVPLDDRTMDTLSTVAGRLDNMVRQFGSYEGQYQKLAHTPSDMEFFRQKTLELDAAARELQDAALRREPQRITASYNRIDRTCHDCHERFAVKIRK